MKLIKILIYSLLGLLLHIPWANAQDLEHIEAGKVRIKFTQEFEASYLAMNSTSTNFVASISSMGAVEFESVSSQYNITVFKRVFPFSEKHEAKHRKHELHLWYEVQFSSLQDPREVVNAYTGIVGVQLVKPVYKKVNINEGAKPIHISEKALKTMAPAANTYFNDPLLNDQWHYENDASVVGNFDADIDLNGAWDVTTGDSDVIIAIVDGGIDVAHEDLQDNLWVNELELNGEAGEDDDGNGYIDDIHGYNFNQNGQVTAVLHGTHVAGTVAAVSNNGKGVAGVAGGDGTEDSGVSLMSCQIFMEIGSSSGVAAAYVYAADNGAVIAQSSWGYTAPGVYEEDVEDALAYFSTEAGDLELFPDSPMVGGLPIFATGNNGMNDYFYPAADPNCLSVNSLGPTDQPAPYSNYGSWTDISAPGGDVSFGSIGGVLSTFPGNEYGYLQGTSMACPHVSGVAGLILSHLREEVNTPDELKAKLLQSATPFGPDLHPNYVGLLGVGKLNARASLQSDAKLPPAAISDFRVENILHTGMELHWTVPVDEDDEAPEVYYVWLASEEITEDYLNQTQPYVISNSLAAGQTAILTVSGLRQEQHYYYALQASDRWGNTNEVVYTDGATLSEPIFSFSPKQMSIEIDVTDQAVIEEFVTITNAGESPLLWEGWVENNGPVYEEEEEELATASQTSLNTLLKDGPQVKMNADGTASIDFGGIYDVNGEIGYASTLSTATEEVELLSVKSQEVITIDTLIDRTRMFAGIYHEDTDWWDEAFTQPHGNAGFITTDRFQVPVDYRLPVTHVQTMLYIPEGETTEQPFIVEICKGGKSVTDEMEVLHAQPYYAREELVGGAAWHYIPLSRKVEVKGGDILWVKIHHPRRLLAYQCYMYTTQFPGDDFYVSNDEGRSYQPSWTMLPYSGFAISKVRLNSAGEDPAHLYFDPIEGSVAGGSEEDVRLVIDAGGLTEGMHSTSALIYTNDSKYPLGSVLVDIDVQGQEPLAEYDKQQSLGVTYPSRVNKVKFGVKNIGLADLMITGVESDADELEYIGVDTMIIAPSFEGFLEMEITPTQQGVFLGVGYLNTNIGKLKIEFHASVAEPSTLDLSTNNIVADVQVGNTTEVSFDVTNTSATQPLVLDLPLGYKEKNKGRIFYTEDHENVGAFEDIMPIGKSVREITMNAWTTVEPIDFHFPYFDDYFEYINIQADGMVWFLPNLNKYESSTSRHREIIELPDTETYLSGIALLAAEMTVLDDILYKIPSEADLVYANMGDRLIVQYDNVKFDLDDEDEGRVTTQLVIYEDGAIEFRYEDLQENSLADSALVGFQNMEGTIGYTIQKRDGTRVVQSNSGYRFIRDYGNSLIADYSETSLEIPPGETRTITALLDPSLFELDGGVHKDYILLNANTESGEHIIDVTLNVEGYPDFEIGTDKLELASVMVDKSDTIRFDLSNEGTAALEVTQLHEGASSFTANYEVPFTLAAGETKRIVLTYAPTVAEEVDEVWEITTNGHGTKQLRISAESHLSPIPQVSLANTHFSLKTGEEVEGELTVENTVDSELEYTINASSLTRFDQNDGDVHTYTYRDSHFDSQVRYDWIEIGDDEKNKIILPTDGFNHYKLPFRYPFYGEMFDEIWVNENGYITAVEPEVSTDPQHGPHGPNLENNGVAGAIMPMRSIWTPNKADPTSGIFLKADDDQVVVEYRRMISTYWGFIGYATFEVILKEDGTIKYQYEEVDNYDGEFWYGLKHINGLDTLDMGRPDVELPDLFDTPFWDYQAILLQPAITKTIDGIGSNTHTFTVDPDRLAAGEYKDTLIVTSNSFIIPTIEVPFVVETEGVEAYKQSTDTLDYGEVFYVAGDERKYTTSFKIGSIGTESLQIDKISLPNLSEAKIYADGAELLLRDNGKLYVPLRIDLLTELTFELTFEATEVNTYEEELKLYVGEKEITLHVLADVILPPAFELVAENLTTNMNTTDSLEHSFVIKNTGDSDLSFVAKPYYEFLKTSTIEKSATATNDFSTEDAASFDSLHYDVAPDAAGAAGNFGTDVPVTSAVRMTAPPEGFVVTHIRAMVDYLEAGIVTVQIYDGSSNWPNGGELLYEQHFPSEVRLGSLNWMLLAFDEGVAIPGGNDFYIIVSHPGNGSQGYDKIQDARIMARQFYKPGPYFGTEGNEWISGDPDNTYRYVDLDGNFRDETETIDYIWKIRALSFQANWMELDAVEGIIPAGESQTLNNLLLGKNMATGLNEGSVNIQTNDPVNKEDKVNYTVTLNGVPYVTYSPDQYGLPVEVDEGDTKVVNLMAADPENDELSFEMVVDTSFTTIEQVKPNQAQLTLNPTYDDQDIDEVGVKVMDSHGNAYVHTIDLKVNDVNRMPIAKQPWAVNMFLEQPIGYTINVAEVFEDPDGDALQYGAINDTPGVIEVAYGEEDLIIMPKRTGVGVVYILTDDGRENGFTYTYVVVYVYSEEELDETAEASNMSVYPNPAIDEVQLSFETEARGVAQVDIVSLDGTSMRSYEQILADENQQEIDYKIEGLPSGVYMIRISTANELIGVQRIIVQ